MSVLGARSGACMWNRNSSGQIREVAASSIKMSASKLNCSGLSQLELQAESGWALPPDAQSALAEFGFEQLTKPVASSCVLHAKHQVQPNCRVRRFTCFLRFWLSHTGSARPVASSWRPCKWCSCRLRFGASKQFTGLTTVEALHRRRIGGHRPPKPAPSASIKLQRCNSCSSLAAGRQ